MNTIIEKIRAEIERRKKELEKDKTIHPANQAGRIKELCLILSTLSDLEKEEKQMTPALQEQPVCEGLYDFMKKRSESLCFHDDFEIAAYKKGVVDGAKWQKEQMMKELSEKIAAAYQLGLADKEKQMLKEAVEGTINNFPYPTIIELNKRIPTKEWYGQKVKIIIVKED